MSRESVLVTGGAGFIGRAVVARALRTGHQVTVLDNLCAGRLKNLEAFADNITFVEADVLDQDAVRSVMERAGPSLVFHLAAHHYIPFCDANPRETLQVNVEGTYAVLSEAARQGVRTAVVASSGAFYPSTEEQLNEELRPAPVDVYGLSKQMTEEVASFIASTTDMRCVAPRLFNTYGPYETNPHLVPHIIESLHEGDHVELGNVHTKRDYIYVEDVADLLYACAERASDPYTVVNVGTGEEHSAADIVATLEALLGRSIDLSVSASRVRNVDKLHQRADATKLRRLTGSHPRHDLRDGLAELLRHEGLLPAERGTQPAS
jgi:UDP-glucose 4-epimerase